MYSLLVLAVSSFTVSLVLTPLCRNLFRRWGLFDQPDHGRKTHATPVPRAGGVPIALAGLLSVGVVALLPSAAGGVVQHNLPLLLRLLPAAALVFAVGLIDDIDSLKPWQKLVWEIVAATWACIAGVQIQNIGGYHIQSWWSYPLTVAWFIGCTNAFNLIDGVDGLAAGVGLFATLTTLVAALLQNNIPLVMATIPLAGSLLGFLRYNFNPASIFLGDSGSLLIGFLLGCYGVVWSQKSATLLGMTAPLMALAIPLLEVGLSIVRRVLRGQPIFQADRGHIHHRLLDRGLTPRGVALLLYGACGLFASFSLVQSVYHNRFAGAVLVLFCVVAWIGVQNLGYLEFQVARRMLAGGAFQQALDGQVRLRNLEETLIKATTFEECWAALRDACRTFGFAGVRMRFEGRVFEEHLQAARAEGCWTLRIALSEYDYINLERQYDSPAQPMVVAALVEMLKSRLYGKLRSFEWERSAAIRKPGQREVPEVRLSRASGAAD